MITVRSLVPLGVATLACGLGGCTDDPVAAAGSPSALEAIGGDGQLGVAGYVLPDSLQVKLLDSEGLPVVGAVVYWATDDRGGNITPASTVTDQDGIARTSWRLGSDDGVQLAGASFQELPGARFTANATSGDVIDAAGTVAVQCGRYGDGVVRCWTAPDAGAASAVALDTDIRFLSLAFVAGRWCGGTRSGSVACFDLDAMSRGGEFRPEAAAVTQVATGLPLFRQLNGASDSDGGFTWCGIADGSTVWCWGLNDHGQVGTGLVGGAIAMPTPVIGDFKARQLALTPGASCALDLQGVAFCWGEVANRVVAGTADQATPVVVPTQLRFAQIAANGSGAVCGLAPDLNVWCWGSNSQGGLGRGGAPDRTTPEAIYGTDRFVSLGAETTGFLAVTVDRDLVIWGGLGPQVGATPQRVLRGRLFSDVLPGGGDGVVCLRAYPLGSRCLERQHLLSTAVVPIGDPIHGVPTGR